MRRITKHCHNNNHTETQQTHPKDHGGRRIMMKDWDWNLQLMKKDKKNITVNIQDKTRLVSCKEKQGKGQRDGRHGQKGRKKKMRKREKKSNYWKMVKRKQGATSVSHAGKRAQLPQGEDWSCPGTTAQSLLQHGRQAPWHAEAGTLFTALMYTILGRHTYIIARQWMQIYVICQYCTFLDYFWRVMMREQPPDGLHP